MVYAYITIFFSKLLRSGKENDNASYSQFILVIFSSSFYFSESYINSAVCWLFLCQKREKIGHKKRVIIMDSIYNNFLAVIFVSYFSGILYDELNIPTDNFILFLMGYSTIVFFLHTVTLFYTSFRLKKKPYSISN